MVAMKLVLGHVDPWTVACLRILPAALAMVLLLPVAGIPLTVARADWPWLALFSLVDPLPGIGVLPRSNLFEIVGLQVDPGDGEFREAPLSVLQSSSNT